MLSSFSNFRGFVLTTITVLFSFLNIKVAIAQSATRPNILILLTDDQSYNTIHALGNKEIATPNMDKLAKEGTAFMQARIMGGLNGAICCPSRAMILSGRNLFHLQKDGWNIPATDITFPELFRANGYTTFETGKWHQDKESFNRAFSEGDNIFLGGMTPYETGGQYRPKLFHYDSSGQYKNFFWGNEFSSVYFADAAIRFLNKNQKTENPFLMFVAFTSPHDPHTPPSWYGHSYHPDDVSVPENFLPQHPFDNGELDVRDELLLPFPRTKSDVKKAIAKYYGMVSEVDFQIGRILNELKKTGKDKNTIVVFAGDNGLAVGRHGLLGKQNPYEHSIKVPLIFSGAGIPQNKRINEMVYLHDIYPTLCELANITPPKMVESQSLAKAFTNKKFVGRDYTMFAYINVQRAIVKGGFKLVVYNVNGQSNTQLFNLNEDPCETNNLASNSKYQSRLKALYSSLGKAMKEQNDFCDLDKPGWGYPKKLSFEEALKLHE